MKCRGGTLFLNDTADDCQVHLGGHVQTGGYGQLGRSFGLLGDHVLSLEIIDHEGQEREITKAGDPEMFYACKLLPKSRLQKLLEQVYQQLYI